MRLRITMDVVLPDEEFHGRVRRWKRGSGWTGDESLGDVLDLDDVIDLIDARGLGLQDLVIESIIG